MNKEIENFLNTNTFRDLLPFFLSYIQNHVYISPSSFSVDFLTFKFDIFIRDYKLQKLYVPRIIRKLGRIATEASKLNMVEKFSHRTYRVIDCREEKLAELRDNILNPKKSIPIVI